eukprot:273831_1
MSHKLSESKSKLAEEEKEFWCNWKEYIPKSNEEIAKDLLSLKKEHKSFIFINEYLQTHFNIPLKLSNTIIIYLPIRETRKNELISHFDTVPLTKKATKEIQTRSRENITRFFNITETKGMLSPHKIENPIQMLDYYIYEVYWYRMGIQKYSEGYPYQPSDILGILRNNKWFYYKDGHPQQFKKHRQWICLTANTLNELINKMDYRDINNFIYNYTKWSPMDLKRCGCDHCHGYYDGDGKPKPLKLLILPTNTNKKKYEKGNELQISLIGGDTVKKSNNKCCSCVIV